MGGKAMTFAERYRDEFYEQYDPDLIKSRGVEVVDAIAYTLSRVGKPMVRELAVAMLQVDWLTNHIGGASPREARNSSILACDEMEIAMKEHEIKKRLGI